MVAAWRAGGANAFAATEVAAPVTSYASVAPPAFGAGGARTPHATRDTSVLATVRFVCDKGDNGAIEVYVNAALQGQVLLALTDADAIDARTVTSDHILSFTVPAGLAYYLDDIVNAGTPAFTFADLQERTL